MLTAQSVLRLCRLDYSAGIVSSWELLIVSTWVQFWLPTWVLFWHCVYLSTMLGFCPLEKCVEIVSTLVLCWNCVLSSTLLWLCPLEYCAGIMFTCVMLRGCVHLSIVLELCPFIEWCPLGYCDWINLITVPSLFQLEYKMYCAWVLV